MYIKCIHLFFWFLTCLISFIIQICLLYAFIYIGPLSTRQARYYMKISVLILCLWISMTMTIRLLGVPLPMLLMLICCRLIPILMILVTMTMVVVQNCVTQFDWNLTVVDRVQYWLPQKKRMIHQPSLKHAIIFFLFLIS